MPTAKLHQLGAGRPAGVLSCGPLRMRCALGPAGVRAMKREGDGGTPFGVWPIRQVHYRPDKVRRPRTALPVRLLRPSDGWCDAADDRNYNRRVALPYPASAESLWREDDLYDVIVELGFNDAPRGRGRGSAIFLHVARLDLAPTAGCIALHKDDLLALIELPDPPRWIDTRRAS
jgi:L,D-peptidoglycan transpeptidase YkuD (ErfK/YbiS/YcfS/YnhG family)